MRNDYDGNLFFLAEQERLQEATPVYHCAKCGEPIYDGDPYWDFGDGPTCEACNENMKQFA